MNLMQRLLGFLPGGGRRRERSARLEYTRGQVQQIVHSIRARYDAAQTTDENRKHWAHADDLSANSANSPDVRRTLRRRARYERDNNSYCKGIVATLAGDLIGTGPRLQLQNSDAAANRAIEMEFSAWCEEVDLAGKLRILDLARHVDGEGFALFVNNPKLSGPVQLDLRPLEADQIETPAYDWADPLAVSGIRFDRWGNPHEYHVLPYHPGDQSAPYSPELFKPYPASEMLHWFKVDRPGQARGIPTLTPAIPLFAQLRRYTLAVLMAAEIAAELAAFVQSNLPPGTDEPATDPFELLEIVRGQITTLPQGWSISQLNPTQPTTGFGEFVERIIKEIARCLEMPWGLAGGDSSGYNYSSGRLDIQTYTRKVKIEREDLVRRLIDKIFYAWLREARAVYQLIPASLGDPRTWRWTWHWDQFGHVDPSKEANAIQTLLAINATTLSRVYAERGEDWLEALEQLAHEKTEMERLGITSPQAPADPPPEPSTDPEPAEGVTDAADA